jgi:Zn-finger nucleic acid-binding protein
MLIACPKCHRQYDVGSYPEGSRVRCLCGNLCQVPRPRARAVEMLHCSNCGGRLASAKKTCEYCSAEIRLADRGLGPACPECFASTLADASYCSTCGTRLQAESILRALVDRPCPRCKQPLTECEGAAVRYVECSACGGLWLDEELFERIARDRDGGIAEAVRGTLPAVGSSAREATVSYVPCPVCGELMNRRNFASCSGIVLDWCRGHGWWFDPDELARALAFLENGGMERSRVLAHERRLEELRREKRRTDAAPLPLPFPAEPFGRSRWGILEALVDLVLS